MSYLPFNTEQAASERNMIEAIRRGCDMAVTKYWWTMANVGEVFYLNVGDMEGLTDEEQLRVELELPNLSETNNETR